MLLDKPIKELAILLKRREISSVDLVEEAYSVIEKLNPTLHSFISVREKEEVIAEAKKKDLERNEQSSILHGLPYSLKDGYVTKDLQTTAASKVLDGFISPYNATVYDKLQQAGAILIGKNNMDAWGHGGSTENTDYQTARNPWNITKVPGGSSGGSAIAVATRMVAFAIGEDTGGSIRNPSNMCNISGLKVTYGRVSRYGAIAYASSLDTVGPMAKNVEDLAIILEVIAGDDKNDATSSLRKPEAYSQGLEISLKGKKIGIPKEFFGKGLNDEVEEKLLGVLKVFTLLGAKVVDVSIPFMKYGVPIYYLIALSETSSNLAWYDGIRFGHTRDNFTAETLRRIIIGTYALSAGYSDKLYKKAQKARTVLIEEFNKVFEQCDVILSPVMPGPPPTIGEIINDPMQNLLEDLYTVTVNLVGIPSLAIPAGFNMINLPIGVQLMGKKFAEKELLQFGYAYQKATDWHKNVPPISL